MELLLFAQHRAHGAKNLPDAGQSQGGHVRRIECLYNVQRKAKTLSAKRVQVQHEGGRCSQPIRTGRGWFLMYHGVETAQTVGIYRTFLALLGFDDPSGILRPEDWRPSIQANRELTRPIMHQLYSLPTPVVLTIGVADADNHYYIVVSGEAELACRITYLPKALFT
jgi:hypothetical protein